MPARRAADGRTWRRWAAGALALPLDGEPVPLGQALLLTAGLVVTVTAPLLRPDRHGWLILAAVSTTMTAVLLASRVLPWARLPRQATLVFPIAVWAALATLGLGAELGAPYGGLFVLCAAYTGLTQPAAMNLALVAPAAATYVAAQATWSTTLAIRLLIVAAVWVLLSQLLAAFTARQQTLTAALHAAAHTDVLTGLPNRRDLQARLLTARPGDTVVLLDLDHFKQLNDSLGHAARPPGRGPSRPRSRRRPPRRAARTGRTSPRRPGRAKSRRGSGRRS